MEGQNQAAYAKAPRVALCSGCEERQPVAWYFIRYIVVIKEINNHRLYWFCLSVFFSVCSFAILWNANWILGDDYQFLSNTAIGKFGAGGISGDGRYWPLGLFDYNILTLIPMGHTPIAHYIWNTITLLLTYIFLLKTFWLISKKYFYSLSIIFLLFTCCIPSFCCINLDVIFSERMLILFFAAFVYFFIKSETTDKSKYYLYAVFCVIYATYCKEPVFSMFLVFTVFEILRKNVKKEKKLFLSGLILNSLIYLICYYKYADLLIGRSYLISAHFLFSDFLRNSLLLLLWSTALLRCFILVFSRDRLIIFDSLLFSAVSYSVAYLILGLSHHYYVIPAIFLSVPVLYYWCCRIFDYNFKFGVYTLAIIIICSAIGFPFNKTEANRIYQSRKNDISVLESYSDKVQNIFIAFDVDENFKDYVFYVLNCFMKFLNKKYITMIDVDTESCHIDIPETNQNYYIWSKNKNFNKIIDENFSCIAQVWRTNIFIRSKLQKIESNFHYIFKTGLVDPHISFNCFKNFSASQGADSYVSNPKIRFILDNKYDYEVVFNIRLEKNNTFGQNSIETNWFVNDTFIEAREIFLLKRKKDYHTVSLKIPKSFIHHDGSTIIECKCPELFTEKDLNRSEQLTKRGLRFFEVSVKPAKFDCSGAIDTSDNSFIYFKLKDADDETQEAAPCLHISTNDVTALFNSVVSGINADMASLIEGTLAKHLVNIGFSFGSASTTTRHIRLISCKTVSVRS